jgi:hypothetical protein
MNDLLIGRTVVIAAMLVVIAAIALLSVRREKR